MMKKNIVVIGGSKGIGLAVAKFYSPSHNLWSVSRSRSPYGEWIEADISEQFGIDKVAEKLSNERIDVLMFLGGTWENNAFTAQYNLLESNFAEIDNIIKVNCLAPIKLVKSLYDNLMKSDNPRAVFIGALSALENQATREVANSASKYGLRGAIHALRQELKNSKIGFTVINPGNVATPEVMQDIESGNFHQQEPISIQDIIAVIECAINLSKTSYLQEVNIAQLNC